MFLGGVVGEIRSTCGPANLISLLPGHIDSAHYLQMFGLIRKRSLLPQSSLPILPIDLFTFKRCNPGRCDLVLIYEEVASPGRHWYFTHALDTLTLLTERRCQVPTRIMYSQILFNKLHTIGPKHRFLRHFAH